jgi:hypothetical protein
MKQQTFPEGWDDARVKRLIAHYDQMSDEELIAEDEAAEKTEDHTVMIVPSALVPAIRELMAREASNG